MAPPATVTREQLRELLERSEGLVVVDALPPMSYAASHLPGAINLPPELVDRWAPVRIAEKAAQVVVYCAGPDCDSSLEVAQRLIELGYTHVCHYPGGKSDWVAAGLPLERAQRRRA